MSRIPPYPFVRPIDREISKAPSVFCEDVIKGLRSQVKTIPCKYFYDERGAALFEGICKTPEYYPTRTEIALLEHHGAEIAALIGREAQMIEYGAGAGIKTRILLEAAPVKSYVALDISPEFLDPMALALAEAFPHIDISALCVDFTKPFSLPALPAGSRRVGFFPGSTIGNFTQDEASAFLRNAARSLGPNGALIVGVDLKKDRRILNAAYNDAAGLTAAFNLNLLTRINRELDGAFDLKSFVHCALYDPKKGRVEMYLYSLGFQTVRVDEQMFTFSAGEAIHTENSQKYDVEEFQILAAASGFAPVQAWVDDQRLFSIHYLAVN
jgi:dimethylhistidine N-methyltransferase